jgi:hypothetical protein
MSHLVVPAVPPAPPASPVARRWHAAAAALSLLAGALWTLHVLVRPDCPPQYARFDFGVPVGVAVVCLAVGAFHALRGVWPTRRGIPAMIVVPPAVLLALAGVSALMGDAAGRVSGCWAF